MSEVSEQYQAGHRNPGFLAPRTVWILLGLQPAQGIDHRIITSRSSTIFLETGQTVLFGATLYNISWQEIHKRFTTSTILETRASPRTPSKVTTTSKVTQPFQSSTAVDCRQRRHFSNLSNIRQYDSTCPRD